MNQGIDCFKLIKSKIDSVKELSSNASKAKCFLGQEILRFISIAGTLNEIDFKLDESASVDERYVTHTLMRSLLENFFKIIYIFDDASEIDARFDKALNGFKGEYLKLFNDLKSDAWVSFMNENSRHFPTADAGWGDLNKLINFNDLLVLLKNNHGYRLQYLYPLYRITSFDTHGNSLEVFFRETFGTQVNFPIIKIKYAINLIAIEYLELFNKVK